MEDLWLVYRCRQGDPEAFAQLYQRYARKVYRTALQLVHRKDLAEDITQEAFMTAFQEIHRLRTPAAFRTWLYRILVSRATRLLRQEGGARRPLSLESLPDPVAAGQADLAEAAADLDQLAELREAIDGLDEDLRLTVLLHYYTGLPVSEVAAALAVPPGTVKSRLFTARRRLAEALAAGTGRTALRKELSV
ncbi:MAG TPA: sigma-70 family RNA polymerase sigma factor [Symbiobacteriaceae bacterium]|nr:sigma-70 family RNA polymerase sigma factor [Symbiobacteriaceae bacterium]